MTTTTFPTFPTRRHAHGPLREGAVGGALAASGVAALYLVGDVLAGLPFVTPRLLGGALGSLLGLGAVTGTAAGAVLSYTVAHFAAFAALGVLAAAVARLAWRHDTVLAGALLVFAVVEVAFAGTLALLDQLTLTGALTWPQLATGNVVGLVILGAWLRRTHPELRAEFARAVGGRQ